MQKICLDTGIITQFFTQDCDAEVNKLRVQILDKKYEIFVLKAAMVEVYYHLCKAKSKEIANIQVPNFIHQYQPNLVELDESLMISAGLLKCQHAKNLSYNDCMIIAFCINEKLPLHTTEKFLKKIPSNILQKLVIVKYNFPD